LNSGLTPNSRTKCRSRVLLALEIITVSLAALYIAFPHFVNSIFAHLYLHNSPPGLHEASFDCVFEAIGQKTRSQIGTCAIPTPMAIASRIPVDRFETDLRSGKFNLRQTDLVIEDAGTLVPLTRTYTAQDWVESNPMHAFGMNSSHPYDIAPTGTRNPYTELFIVLEDGDFLFFPAFRSVPVTGTRFMYTPRRPVTLVGLSSTGTGTDG
jgi:hypothetical protein